MTGNDTNTKGTQMFKITYGDHDCGCTGGSMIRETRERAERTAQLMGECGYRTVAITEV